MPRIHPTAIVDPAAKLADDVEVGPYAIVEPDVEIGPGCVLRANSIVRRYTTMGRNNIVDSFTVIGGEPQDLKFDPATPSYVRIGDGNVFREHCTVSRATGQGSSTTIGDRCYLMTGAHVGHEAVLGNDCVLVNRAALAGHSRIADQVILSAHVSVHQFTWVGRGVMSQGNSIMVMHVPPFCLTAGTGQVVSLNLVGLRRSADLTREDRKQIREAFDIFYRSGLPTNKALERMKTCEWNGAASEFRDFVREALEAAPPYRRGIAPLRSRRRSDEEYAGA
jgi:UDP-N-acetylglucosamine acyltransferase